jgi:hypothetical protein
MSFLSRGMSFATCGIERAGSPMSRFAASRSTCTGTIGQAWRVPLHLRRSLAQIDVQMLCDSW